MSTPCPTCGFAVPDGRQTCPQCGRVFGEANRCPHCHAIASVRASGERFVCTACGKPRELVPGTTVRGADAAAPLAGNRGLRALAALLLTGAVLGAALSTAVLGTGALGIAVAIAVGASLAFTGVRVLGRANDRARALSDHAAATRKERARLFLLERTSTVPELAAELGTSEAEADALATTLAAEERDGIQAQLDEKEGVVRFGRKPAAAQVRIADPDEETEPPADEEAERDRTSDRAEAVRPRSSRT